MKTFLFFLIMQSCTVTDPPLLEEGCMHEVNFNDERQRLEIEIYSKLPSVKLCWSTDAQVEHCITVQANYYECTSMSLPDDETLITIYAETTCEYVY